MPDIFRFGLLVAVLIAAGVACLLIALTPTPPPSSTMTVFPGTEHHTTSTPYQLDTETITSDA